MLIDYTFIALSTSLNPKTPLFKKTPSVSKTNDPLSFKI